jgi:hypothetical protein
MSQVTISPPAPRGERKICGQNDTGTKKMWVEKFKSPTVPRTNHVGQIVTRTKSGWTKCQGTKISLLSEASSGENSGRLKIDPEILM